MLGVERQAVHSKLAKLGPCNVCSSEFTSHMGVSSPTELQDIERLGAARFAAFIMWLSTYCVRCTYPTYSENKSFPTPWLFAVIVACWWLFLGPKDKFPQILQLRNISNSPIRHVCVRGCPWLSPLRCTILAEAEICRFCADYIPPFTFVARLFRARV